MVKVKEVVIVKEVMAGDVLPVAMFFNFESFCDTVHHKLGSLFGF